MLNLREHRGADAGHTGDETIGSSPERAALLGRRQRHRLGSRLPFRPTVSDKYFLAEVSIIPTDRRMAGYRNHLGNHRCHHWWGIDPGRTGSCEGSGMR